jgi:arginyl-tRNA--protein-N-Asp/Glu arginylyltransferase
VNQRVTDSPHQRGPLGLPLKKIRPLDRPLLDVDPLSEDALPTSSLRVSSCALAVNLPPVDEEAFDSCPIPALPPPAGVRLTVLPSHDCPYLPGRTATFRGFMTDGIPGDLYHRFMDAGFRRSGRVFYQPVCRGCRECVPVRVSTDRFRPGKSQRRAFRRNADLTVTVERPNATDEKYDLYRRYVEQWHGRESSETGRAAYESFLCDSAVDTIEFLYRDPSGKLLAVGVCDVCRDSLSSVYLFFDPAERSRSLGVYSAVSEMEWARQRGIGFYYLGYWVRECRRMSYKIRFNPAELLGPEGIWKVVSGIADISS